jgi:hypothetical protein
MVHYTLHAYIDIRTSPEKLKRKLSACSFGWWLMAGADLF